MADAHGTVCLHISKENILAPGQLYGWFLPTAEEGDIEPIFQNHCGFCGKDFQILLQIFQILCMRHATALGKRVADGMFPRTLKGCKLQKHPFLGFYLARGFKRIEIGQMCKHGLRVVTA